MKLPLTEAGWKQKGLDTALQLKIRYGFKILNTKTLWLNLLQLSSIEFEETFFQKIVECERSFFSPYNYLYISVLLASKFISSKRKT